MTESKLWHKKTGIKNAKSAKMVEFNFGHFFSSIILPPFCWAKNRISENAVVVKWSISFWLGEHFAWWNEQKWEDSIFQFTNVSSSNINTINLKLFQGPRRDFGNARAKNVLDALENETKRIFQENISGKVRFQEKWGLWGFIPLPPPPCHPPYPPYPPSPALAPSRWAAYFPQPWLVGHIYTGSRKIWKNILKR